MLYNTTIKGTIELNENIEANSPEEAIDLAHQMIDMNPEYYISLDNENATVIDGDQGEDD